MSKEELARMIRQTVAEEVRKHQAAQTTQIVDVRKQLAAIASNDAARAAAPATPASTRPLTAGDVQSIANFVAESPSTTEAERLQIAATILKAQHAGGPQSAIRKFGRPTSAFWSNR